MTPRPTVSFDARPLTDPVDPRAVTAFARQMKANRPTSAGTIVLAVVIVAVVIVPLITVLFSVGVGLSLAVSRGSGSPLGVILAVLVIGGLIALIVWLSLRAYRSAQTTRYRLSRFAGANSMTYVDRITNPPLPGMIFHLGSSRAASELVRGEHPRFVEFGNYQYTVKSGKNSTTHRWGYVAVKLDVPLPNIVLDAVGNNSLFGSNLPAQFRKTQKLSLEGDFDQYFTLYCPEGYERDALYLFTPDIMARFIDNAAFLDVEIVDDWMFLYVPNRASTLDPRTWAWLFGAVGALMTKFDQWARWRDDRLRAEAGAQAGAHVLPAAAASEPALPFAAPAGMLTPPPGVAHPGRRLRRSVPWIAIVFVIAILGFSFLPMAFAFFGAFFGR
ncbi:MAG: hypothetical protein ACQEW8_13090 [Actinomycetota bacterium]